MLDNVMFPRIEAELFIQMLCRSATNEDQAMSIKTRDLNTEYMRFVLGVVMVALTE